MGIRRCRAVRVVCVVGAAMAAVTALALPAAAAGPAQGTKARLAINRNFPDPAILHAGTRYFAYSTNSGGVNLPIAVASNPFGRWRSVRHDGLPRLGAWANTGKTWAPDVSRISAGHYVDYYTAADKASGRQCIGVATASKPDGVFHPVGTRSLICPASIGGAIDAAGFADGNKRYVVYKNDGNAIGVTTYIWLQRVSSDGLRLIGSPRKLIHNTGNEGNLVEAPYLIHRSTGYYLFFSYGAYNNSTYTEGWARARTLTGRFRKSSTPLLSTAGFKGKIVGPGGASVLQQRGGDIIVFHGVKNQGQPDFYRPMYVARLTWHGDRPYVR